MTSLYPRAQVVLPTPLGRSLLVACGADEIVESRFTARPPSTARIAEPLLREAAAQVRAYFARTLRRFALPLHLDGTAFEFAVWNYVAQMETEELISYADLARVLGRPRAARGVARAMSRAPLALFIPAHRVVGSDGTVRGASRGSMRRRLLAFEGITLR